MEHLYEEGYTQDRELSWLKFNARVLEEAADRTVPALERLKFIGIFQSNLDEFFMVRDGSLIDQREADDAVRDVRTGRTPSESLEAVLTAVPQLLRRRDELYRQVLGDLAAAGVRHLRPEDLTAAEWSYLRASVIPDLLQAIGPVIVPAGQALPELRSGQSVMVCRMPADAGMYYGLIPVPETLPAYYVLRSDEEGVRILKAETLLRMIAAEVFAPFDVRETVLLRIERNAQLREEEEEADLPEDFRLRMKALLRKRAGHRAVRLEADRPLSRKLSEKLTGDLGIRADQIILSPIPGGTGYVYDLERELPERIRKRVCYRPFTPRDRYPAQDGRILDRVRAQDLLLSMPYDSIDPLVRMLEEASSDPQVREIRMTVYRLASRSRIVDALCRAAEQGIKVRVVIELRARFDEQNNIDWSEKLIRAGCKVTYGSDCLSGYKVHCKLCQVRLSVMGEKRWITYIGTGNFNEKTACLYTDLGLLTYDQEIGREAARYFRDLLRRDWDGHYEHLLAAPSEFRTRFLELIDRETAKGAKGRIFLKVNSVTDPVIIDRLAQASEAGVRIRMIVRGICCLLPGVPMCTENIEIVNVVGRFLEHSRVYVFGSGKDEVLYISSADLMTRNTARRAELACPVYDAALRQEIRHILLLNFYDNVKGRRLNASGAYEVKKQDPSKEAVRLDSQLALLQYL